MTFELKGKITDILRESRNEGIPSYEITELIANVVDADIANVLIKTCQFGEILDAFDLEIKQKQ